MNHDKKIARNNMFEILSDRHNTNARELLKDLNAFFEKHRETLKDEYAQRFISKSLLEKPINLSDEYNEQVSIYEALLLVAESGLGLTIIENLDDES